MAWWGPSGPRLIESHVSRDVPGNPGMSHGLMGALRSESHPSHILVISKILGHVSTPLENSFLSAVVKVT